MMVVNDNTAVIDFVDVDPSINDKEEKEAERWGICISATPLWLLFLLRCHFTYVSASEEKEEANEAFALPTTKREEASEAKQCGTIQARAITCCIFRRQSQWR